MKTLIDEKQKIPGLFAFKWSGKGKAIDAADFEHKKGYIEIFYSISGNHVFHVEGRDYLLYGGDAMILKGGLTKTVRKHQSIGELVLIQIDTVNRNGFLFLNKMTAERLISRFQDMTELCVRTDNEISKRLLRLIIAELTRKDESQDVEKVVACLTVFLYNLLLKEKTNSRRATVDIVRACEYIDDHICDEILLEDIAKEINLSTSQFKYKFKKQIGISPRSYINQQKIERIKDEIKDGCSFTEIAENYGFCNSAYFSVIFKKYTGETPTQYLNYHSY